MKKGVWGGFTVKGGTAMLRRDPHGDRRAPALGAGQMAPSWIEVAAGGVGAGQGGVTHGGIQGMGHVVALHTEEERRGKRGLDSALPCG
jgi:hypothetical protein